MDATQAAGGFEISEVRIEQWLLAALRLQRGLSLKPRRPRRHALPAARPSKTRGSLWLMLGASCLGLCLL